MKIFLKRREIEELARAANVSYEQMKKQLSAVDIDEMERYRINGEIMDRVNRRLQGEYVIPAWVESLRGR